MELTFCNSNDKVYQQKLNELLKNVFLDFKFWYDLDLWDDKYESYAFLDNGEIVSNIGVYKTQIMYKGELHPALSIGGVCTRKEYRGKGLSRKLMEHIIEKYEGLPMYLSANEGVLDFYPRFGFERIEDKQPVCDCKISNGFDARKLQYDDQKVWDYIYKRVNRSSDFDCYDTEAINIFHLHMGYLKDCIYELPEIDTMVVARQVDTRLKLIGVYSLKDVSFEEVKRYLPFENIERIEFGFMPHWDDIEFSMEAYEKDPQFVRGISCELGDIKFPELSYT